MTALSIAKQCESLVIAIGDDWSQFGLAHAYMCIEKLGGFMSLSITKRNLLVLVLVPFMFGCAKSKFSAVNATPPQTQNVPDPVVPTPPDDNHPCHRADHCKPTPPPPECHKCVVTPPPVVVEPPPVVVVPPPPPVVVIPPKDDCKDFPIDMPEYKKGFNGINMWLFVDSSRSTLDNRVAFAASVLNALDTKLARQIPVTVNLVTGHSRKSAHSAVASKTDFFYSSPAGEPAIIHFDPKGNRDAARQQLITKLTNIERDNSPGISDGGELLVYNFVAAFNEERLAWARQQGVLRTDYLLQMMFMSDENDICTPGKLSSSYVKGTKIESEIQAYAAHCFGIDTGYKGLAYTRADANYDDSNFSTTAFNVIEKLKNGINIVDYADGQKKKYKYKTMIGAFAFASKDPNNIPQDASGQNEFGNGIIQLVKAQKGLVIDLGGIKNQTDVDNAGAKWVNFTNKSFPDDLYVKFDMPQGAVEYDDLENAQVYINDRMISTRPQGSVLVAQERCETGRVRMHLCRRKKH